MKKIIKIITMMTVMMCSILIITSPTNDCNITVTVKNFC